MNQTCLQWANISPNLRVSHSFRETDIGENLNEVFQHCIIKVYQYKMALSNQAEVNLALLGTQCIINVHCGSLKYVCVCPIERHHSSAPLALFKHWIMHPLNDRVKGLKDGEKREKNRENPLQQRKQASLIRDYDQCFYATGVYKAWFRMNNCRLLMRLWITLYNNLIKRAHTQS